MNLYQVWDEQYEWCCFIFAHSRNEAKSMWAHEFDQEYISARCKTLKRGVNFPMCKCVDCPDDPRFVCKECGKWLLIEDGTADMNFCPNGGADMRSEGNNENQ